MTQFLFANNASTTIAGPIAANATTVQLAAGAGALFPQPGTGQQFALTLVSQSNTNTREIVYCTARATDVCTIVRGQENTTPTAFVAGDGANNWLTAGTTAFFIQSSQLQQQPGNYAADTGSANSIVAAFNPAPTSLSQLIGVPLRVLIANTNTGNTTFTATPLAPTIATNVDGTNLIPGQVIASGISEFIFDGSTFNLMNPGSAPRTIPYFLSFSAPGAFTVPAGVFRLRVRGWGGGGSGGAGTGGGGGGGGQGGGYFEGVLNVTPGQVFNYTVGQGGATSTGPGLIGGTTTFGPFTATGGAGGGQASSLNSPGLGGGNAGAAGGPGFIVTGYPGGNGFSIAGNAGGGIGGGSYGASNTLFPLAIGPIAGNFPGGGSSGGAASQSANGAQGAILLEY